MQTKTNPFAGLAKSRKFWLLVIDAVASTALYFTAKYFGAAVDDLKFVIAIYQPIVGLVIAGITVEDTAHANARAKVEVAQAQASGDVAVAKVEAAPAVAGRGG